MVELEYRDRTCQFMYSEGNMLHFTDQQTFEEYAVPAKIVKETRDTNQLLMPL